MSTRKCARKHTRNVSELNSHVFFGANSWTISLCRAVNFSTSEWTNIVTELNVASSRNKIFHVYKKKLILIIYNVKIYSKTFASRINCSFYVQPRMILTRDEGSTCNYFDDDTLTRRYMHIGCGWARARLVDMLGPDTRGRFSMQWERCVREIWNLPDVIIEESRVCVISRMYAVSLSGLDKRRPASASASALVNSSIQVNSEFPWRGCVSKELCIRTTLVIDIACARGIISVCTAVGSSQAKSNSCVTRVCEICIFFEKAAEVNFPFETERTLYDHFGINSGTLLSQFYSWIVWSTEISHLGV